MVGSARSSSANASITVPAETSQLSRVRHEVAEMAQRLAADDCIADDLSLVISELMTNAIKHSADHLITIDVQRTDEAWSIEVSGAAEDLDIRGLQPTPSERSGRGMMIVRSIMDHVELVQRASGFRIRCTKILA